MECVTESEASVKKLDERRGRHLPLRTVPALFISSLSIVIAIVALCYRSSRLPALREWRIQTAEYTFIVFASIAMIVLYAGFCERWQLHRFLDLPGIIFPFVALLAAGVYKLSMHQFGGFDEGMLVHAASYYAQGFKPYADFPCSMPPFFMAAIRWDVKLLGLQWSSLALIPVTFCAITSLWIFALLRRIGVFLSWALAVTICVEMSTMLTTPFWWYNNSSYIAVILLTLSTLACLQQPSQPLHWMSLSLSLATVLVCKPNDLPACLMVLGLLATKDKLQWLKTLSACVGSLGVALFVCNAAQMQPTMVLHSYREIATLRGNPFPLLPFQQMGLLERDFQVLFMVETAYCFAVLLRVFVRQHPNRWRLSAVCAIAALTSLLMACTNAESKHSDLSIMLVASAILCLRPWEMQEVSSLRKTVLVGFLSAFFVMSGLFCAFHLRVLGIGEGMFYEPLPTRSIQSGFFCGLEAGPRLQRVLQQTTAALSAYPSQRVFFGPRMEFGYAVFNKSVTQGMPLVWDVGNLFAEEKLPHFLSTFQNDDPDLLIFLKEDFTRMGIVAGYIIYSGAYTRNNDFSDITVFIRKKREIPKALDALYLLYEGRPERMVREPASPVPSPAALLRLRDAEGLPIAGMMG